MPEVCRFYGIVIRMYFDDHPPPHIRAAYGGEEAVLGIDHLAVLSGRLPRRARDLVAEWASLHREELKEAWERASRLEAPGRIAPLD